MARVDQNSVLMLIDVQKAWKEPVWGRRNNPGAEDAMERVLGGVSQEWPRRDPREA